MAENDSDFVEVKILDDSISQSTFDNWTIQICEYDDSGNNNDSDGCSGSVSVSTFTDSVIPWIVLTSTTSANIGKYINFKAGFDAVLLDENGYIVDYITVDGRNAVETDLGCTVSGLPYDTAISAPGASDKFIFRTPDGTGDWDDAVSASADPTESDTNDSDPDGNVPPTVTVTDVSVNKGETATFTFTLDGAAKSYNITITYETTGGTATSGTDYTYITGTATISAGSTSTTVDVTTDASSSSGEVYFYLFLSDVVNATLNNHYPVGTILDASIDHFLITHDGTALTCEPESVTISACADATCSTLYTSDVSVTLSPTGWVGGDTQTISGGSGSFELRNTTAGTYTLAVSSATPAATNADVCFDSSDSSSSCSLTYYDSGFVYSIPTQTSCETSADITISAVRLDETSQQCVPTFANRSETIQFWTTYVDPDPVTGSPIVTLNNGSDNYTMATASPGTDVPLTFDASGEDTITVNYQDAGQLTLNSSFTGEDDETGLSMTGATTYVTKPAKFYVYSNDTDADCASGDATCSAFVSAGTDFNLNVRAACADNTVTPNFVYSGLTLSSTLIEPSGGDDGTLGVTSANIVAVDNGEVTISTQNISEVGVFTFTADLTGGTDYLGETVIGTTADNTSANIGRFYPDYFDVSYLDGCSAEAFPFTYSGQSFTVSITAMNADDVQTLNYTDTFVKEDVVVSDDSNDSSKFTNYLYKEADFTNGYGISTDVTYTFTSKDTNVTPINLRAKDTDNVTSEIKGTEPTINIYSGRVNIENAFGSELLDLAVPVTVEYYDGSSYVTNTLDSNCTAITLTLSDPDGTDTLTAGIGAAGETCIRDDAILSGTNNCAAIGSGEQYTEPPSSGDFNVWLLAPTATHTGYMDVNGTVDSWLQYDWNGTGLEDPSGRAAFGLYRGDDRIIYWREQY